MIGGNAECRTIFHKVSYLEVGKSLYSTYVKSDLEQVAANATQLNSEERTELLRILKDFEDLFDGTLR